MVRDNNTNMGERVRAVEVTLDEIKTNHLPHLQAGLDDINKKIIWGLIAIVSTFIGIVINIGLIYFQAHVSSVTSTLTTTNITK